MRKLILYVATTEDGFLADAQGSVDWIPEQEDFSDYEAFYENVDTILMGRVTYEQITQEICPDVWLYGEKKTYVFTQSPQTPLPEIEFTQRKPQDVIRYLKNRKGKDIWLCGGARLISALMEQDLIDEYQINVMPVTLGKGIALFSSEEQRQSLNLVSSTQCKGFRSLVYTRPPKKEL